MNKILLIIDLQENFIKYPYQWWNKITNYDALNIYKYINNNEDFFKEYINIIQIVDILDIKYWDNNYISENSKPNWIYISDDYIDLINIYDEENDEYIDNSDIYPPYEKYINKFIYKEFWFLRNFMDYWYDDELIIEIWKLLYNNDLNNFKDFNKKLYKKLPDYIKENYWHESILDIDEELWIEYELINDILRNIPNKNTEIDLIWGGKDECLKEIYLLLKIIWYNNVHILENLTY